MSLVKYNKNRTVLSINMHLNPIKQEEKRNEIWNVPFYVDVLKPGWMCNKYRRNKSSAWVFENSLSPNG